MQLSPKTDRTEREGQLKKGPDRKGKRMLYMRLLAAIAEVVDSNASEDSHEDCESELHEDLQLEELDTDTESAVKPR